MKGIIILISLAFVIISCENNTNNSVEPLNNETNTYAFDCKITSFTESNVYEDMTIEVTNSYEYVSESLTLYATEGKIGREREVISDDTVNVKIFNDDGSTKYFIQYVDHGDRVVAKYDQMIDNELRNYSQYIYYIENNKLKTWETYSWNDVTKTYDLNLMTSVNFYYEGNNIVRQEYFNGLTVEFFDFTEHYNPMYTTSYSLFNHKLSTFSLNMHRRAEVRGGSNDLYYNLEVNEIQGNFPRVTTVRVYKVSDSTLFRETTTTYNFDCD